MFSYLDPLQKVLKEAKNGQVKGLIIPSSKQTEQHKLIQIYMAGAMIHVYFMRRDDNYRVLIYNIISILHHITIG